MTVTAPGRVELTALTTGDGTPLKLALAQATRRARRRAFLLVCPLLLFVLVTFAVPIAQMLYLSINNPIFSQHMPRLTAYLQANPVRGVPGEEGFAALALDLIDAKKNRTAARVGVRINYARAGSISLFKSTARKVRKLTGRTYREKLLKINEDWADLHLWRVMERASSSHTEVSTLRMYGFFARPFVRFPTPHTVIKSGCIALISGMASSDSNAKFMFSSDSAPSGNTFISTRICLGSTPKRPATSTISFASWALSSRVAAGPFGPAPSAIYIG